jgi:hypothetical protein
MTFVPCLVRSMDGPDLVSITLGQEAPLVRGYVETHIAIDVEWRSPHHTEPAARRIERPPVGPRRRPRE